MYHACSKKLGKSITEIALEKLSGSCGAFLRDKFNGMNWKKLGEKYQIEDAAELRTHYLNCMDKMTDMIGFSLKKFIKV
ncbi:MAG: hypothetical protein AAF206_22330 [Bacteroidota bacterium]